MAMILWLLSHFSTFELILLLVIAPTLVAVGVCLVLQRRFPNLQQSEFDKWAEALRGGFTVLFGLVLGLAIASVSGQLSAARSSVSIEATTLAEMVRASRLLPPDDRARIDAALEGYVHAVAEDEWETMRQGHASERASAAFEQLYAAYTAPTSAADSSASSRSVSATSKLDELTQARRTRLQEAAVGSDTPDLLRILLAIGVIAFIVVWYPAKVTHQRVQLVLVACTAAFILFAYLLTIVLDFPFAGDIHVSNIPFKEGVLGAYW
jgi:hypothetical protein